MTSRQYWSCQNGTGNVCELRETRSGRARRSEGEIGNSNLSESELSDGLLGALLMDIDE